MRPRRSELEARYGLISNGSWPRYSEFLVPFIVPYALQSALLYGGWPTRKIIMNKDMVTPFTTATNLLISEGCIKFIHSYGGCFNIRNVRGGNQISAHAYGLAVDINPDTNPLGKPGAMHQDVVDCFEEAGFVWGGNFKRIDGMHFQYHTET